MLQQKFPFVQEYLFFQIVISGRCKHEINTIVCFKDIILYNVRISLASMRPWCDHYPMKLYIFSDSEELADVEVASMVSSGPEVVESLSGRNTPTFDPPIRQSFTPEPTPAPEVRHSCKHHLNF